MLYGMLILARNILESKVNLVEKLRKQLTKVIFITTECWKGWHFKVAV